MELQISTSENTKTDEINHGLWSNNLWTSERYFLNLIATLCLCVCVFKGEELKSQNIFYEKISDKLSYHIIPIYNWNISTFPALRLGYNMCATHKAQAHIIHISVHSMH